MICCQPVSIGAFVPLVLSRAALITLIISSTAFGQISNVNNATSTPLPGAGHDYIQMLSETVNPANGSVSLRINVPIPPGRQLALPFAFAYDSNGFRTFAGAGGFALSLNQNTTTGGWSYVTPSLRWTSFLPQSQFACPINTGFVFSDENGGRHALGIASDTPCVGQPGLNLGSVPTGGDDIFQAQVIESTQAGVPNTILIANPSGTVYTFHDGPCGTFAPAPDSVEDRNGNRITFAKDCNSPYNSNFSEVDTLGRAALTVSGLGYSGDTVSVSGMAQPYTLTWDTARAAFTLGFALQQESTSGCSNTGHSTADSTSVVSAITLPNGQQFQFTYDGTYGLLNKITYPGGGYVSYTWAPNLQSDFFENTQTVPNPTPGQPNIEGICQYIYDSYAVSQRFVSFDGVTIAQEQDFNYSTTWDPVRGQQCGLLPCHHWGSKTTTVTTHDLIRGTKFRTIYTYTSILAGSPAPYLAELVAPQLPLEQTTVYEGAQGAVLRTVNKTWIDQFELQSEQTILDNGLTDQVTYTYGPGAQITEKDEFDYGPGARGPLLRKSITSYASFPATSQFSSPAILNRPAIQTTYDGSGRQMAQTVYCYDQTTPGDTSTSKAPQHDYKHYSSTFNLRGNTTQLLHWLNPPGGQNPSPTCGQSTSTAALSATFTYDDTGQVLSQTDPRGKTVKYAYGAADAYLTTTTMPAPEAGQQGTTQAMSVATNFDFNSGLLQSVTDANQKTTTYSYNDALNRLTAVNRPDGSSTTYIYTDVPGDLNVHTIVSLDASRSMKSYSYFDGLGQNTRVLHFDGTSGTPWTATDTAYDGIGRVMMVTNPHRVGGPSAAADQCSATLPCTTTNYDALNRITVITTPDGLSVTTAYPGNSTNVTDQAGNTRNSLTDALGRLMQVTENPTNVNGDGSPVTNYFYDALNNLLCVHQKGIDSSQDTGCSATVPAAWRPRNFTYDSLSRLLAASNPESGTTQYSYDNNGNLSTKTDANGTVITTTYDAMNRPLMVTYSDGTSPVTYFYDGTGKVIPGSNPLGRLSVVSSADPSSGSYSYDNYDGMGRVLGTTQTVDGQPYVMSYAYDLAGHLVSKTYPSGRVVQTGYDAAGRAGSVSAQQLNRMPYADRIQYAPHGGMTDLLLGNGLWEHTIYDGSRNQPALPGRLQVTEIGVGTTQGASDILQFNYDYGTANNNGNVRRQMITAPGLAVTQLVQYDGFNRLLKIQEVSGANAPFPFQATAIWEQDFTHDFWGNRTSLVSSSGLLTALAPAVDTNNRIDVSKDSRYVYDAAGRLKQEPVSSGTNIYSYDGEGRLIQAQDSIGTQVFKYDGQGQRVKKIAGNVATVYVRDVNGQLIAEYSNVSSQTNGTRYLTQDILGSERLVTGTDSSNKPAVMARYDYLAFGELIPTGLSTRSSVAGYGASDVSRQEFTGKERDFESGLDNFGPRYYSSSMGRFMSADPSNIGADRVDPQSWNAYSYSLNNPLILTDPTGLYVCEDSFECDSENDKRFAKSLADAQKAANDLKTQYGANSDEYTSAQRAIDAYGEKGVDNGVNIRFDSNIESGHGVTEVSGIANGSKSADNPKGQNINVTFNPDAVGKDLSGGLVAHEGTHVADGSDWVKSGFAISKNPTNGQTELKANHVQFNIMNVLLQTMYPQDYSASLYGGSVRWKKGDTFQVITPSLKRAIRQVDGVSDTKRAFVKRWVLEP